MVETSISEKSLCRFAIYINKVSERRYYISLFQSCRSATEVALVVSHMVQDTPGLSFDTINTELFINILVDITIGVTSGRSVPNFRKAMVDAWVSRKE